MSAPTTEPEVRGRSPMAARRQAAVQRPSTVLYDAPGPRARRTAVIVSIVVALLLVAVAYLFVYRPLEARGQFTMEKWGPIVDPGNENFRPLWQRLFTGFRATLTAAGLAIVASLVLGTGLAILRVQLKALRRRRFTGFSTPVGYAVRALAWVLNVITRFCIEVFRGMPVVITIFFVSTVLPEIGLNLHEALWYLVVGLTIYNMVVIGEILRSGMEGLPRGQGEAAATIGLTSFQTTRLVLLPQAFRIMLPALISQLVVVLKDTSLGFFISYEEVLRVTSQAIQVLGNPIQLYFVVGVIYIAANYALSKLAQYVERRLSSGHRTVRAGKVPPAGLVNQAEAGRGTAAAV